LDLGDREELLRKSNKRHHLISHIVLAVLFFCFTLSSLALHHLSSSSFRSPVFTAKKLCTHCHSLYLSTHTESPPALISSLLRGPVESSVDIHWNFGPHQGPVPVGKVHQPSVLGSRESFDQYVSPGLLPSFLCREVFFFPRKLSRGECLVMTSIGVFFSCALRRWHVSKYGLVFGNV